MAATAPYGLGERVRIVTAELFGLRSQQGEVGEVIALHAYPGSVLDGPEWAVAVRWLVEVRVPGFDTRPLWADEVETA